MLAKRYNVVQMHQFFSSKSCVPLRSLPARGETVLVSPRTGRGYEMSNVIGRSFGRQVFLHCRKNELKRWYVL